jgi:hypothetical protein|tara:strand:- start:134 stop:490 length:357 start_codon:yes stop_codon:yes gene_type:complete
MASLLIWHRSSLRGEEPERHETVVHCGWFKLKEIKGGPWVPAKIYIYRETCRETGELLCDELFRLDINGIEFDPYDKWTFLKPISKEDYAALIQRQRDIPAMQATRTRIDLAEEPILP